MQAHRYSAVVLPFVCMGFSLADQPTATTPDTTADMTSVSSTAHSPFPRSYHFSNSVPVVVTHPNKSVLPIGDPEASLYSDRGPVVSAPEDYLLPPGNDPFEFLEQGTMFVRTLAAKLNFSFMPQMIYTYQHASRVLPGSDHGYSYIYTNINGAMPVNIKADDPTGHFVYNIQGNSGLGTPTTPFIEDAVGSPYFLNNVLTGGRLSLKKFWWRQMLFDKKLTLNIGKLYYANFFDLNKGAQNPADQFLAAQLTNNTAVPFASYGAGVVGNWEFNKEFYARIGTMNALASGRASGFEKLDEGKLFTMAQFGWTPSLRDGDLDLQGHYRGFAWYSNNDVFYEDDGWGVGISFDQELGGGLIGFLRWGWGEDGAAPATMCWSSGFVLNGIMGRKMDGVGIGFALSDLTNSGTATGDGWETVVEGFWRIQVSPTMQFGPSVQYFSSGETDGISNTWIWGLRSTWNF
jgi:hypothetical protein